MTYELKAVKAAFSSAKKLRMTVTALKSARSIGFSMQDIVEAIQQLTRKDFIKSMTTYHDNKIWQDVYNTEFNGYCLYIKFQVDKMGHFIISFKEK